MMKRLITRRPVGAAEWQDCVRQIVEAARTRCVDEARVRVRADASTADAEAAALVALGVFDTLTAMRWLAEVDLKSAA